MKNHSFLVFTLILFLISVTDQQTLDLTTYKTATFQAQNWQGLIEMRSSNFHMVLQLILYQAIN